MSARRSIATALGLLVLLATGSMSPAAAIERCGSGQRDDATVARAAKVEVAFLADLRDVRALSNDDICTMPARLLARAILRTRQPKPDSPGEWAQFRAMEQRGNDQTVDPSGLIRGLASRQNLLRQIRTGAIRAMDAGISSEQWTALGPGNIGGRIRTIAISPTNPDKIWIGAALGGIWVSSDGGQSWRAVNDFMASVAVSTIVIDPKNPSIMYAGTGEGFFNADAIRGAGVFKSVDEGETWQPLAATNPKNNEAWFYVNRLAIQPDNPKVILAATNDGLYRTENAGEDWTKVDYWSGKDIDFDPHDPGAAIAGSRWGAIQLSRDGGRTWKRTEIAEFSDGSGRVETAYAPSAPGVVYASVDFDMGRVLRSEDGGESWRTMSMPKHLSGQGWFANALWVDPLNDKHLIVGGLDLYRSVDGGQTFAKISKWSLAPVKSAHADHHVIVSPPNYVPGSNPVVYFGNDGGLYRARNVETVGQNSGWENLNNGLAITQFYGVAASADGHNLIGGTQDNGTLMKLVGEGQDWFEYIGGDGGYSQVDQDDGGILYGEYVYLSLHRSLDGGKKTSFICLGIEEGHPRFCNGSGKANFISPFMLDPNNQRRMLAGAASLWVTDDVRQIPVPAWRAIKPPIKGRRNYIKSIAVAKGDSNLIWVGYNLGNVYSTRDGGASWTELGIGPRRAVNRILIDSHNHRRVTVAYGGYLSDNLYRTDDGGRTWRDVSGDLPDVPIRGLVQHPQNPKWLYAGTEVGLYTSENGGQSWSTKNDGPGTVSIEELVWVGNNVMLAATHGRGIFRARINGGQISAAPRSPAPPRKSAARTSPVRKKKKCSSNDIIRMVPGC